MAELNRQTVTGARTGTVAIDEGLRAYMLRVYNYMAAGLAITGVVAYAVFALAVTNDPTAAVAKIGTGGIMLTEFGRLVFVSPLKWVLLLAPLGLVFFMSARLHKMYVHSGQLTVWI
jgi:FtsH-binding integral membrane protein